MKQICHKEMNDLEVIHSYLETQASKCFSLLYNRYASKIFSKCISLLKDDTLRSTLGNQGKMRAQQELSREMMVEQIVAVYEATLKDHKC